MLCEHPVIAVVVKILRDRNVLQFELWMSIALRASVDV
jgi:hypothetical protein